MLNDQEVDDLTRRCKYAQAHGFQIGLAEDYAKELGYADEDPPAKVKKFSPAHLLHLLGVVPVAPVSKAPKFAKAGKAKKSAAKDEENLKTVPIDPEAVKAQVEAMKESIAAEAKAKAEGSSET
jgi:hypothetical protein